MVGTRAMFRISAPAAATGDEEFVGPFNTWTQLAATGVAATDTAALQSALTALSSSAPVLYLTGNFVINATLTVTAQQNIQIVGADPATTTILWAGSTSLAMLYLNGVSYSKFSRITFDGDSVAGTIGVDQNYDGTGNYFDTGNEYSDCVFVDLAYGIRGGESDFGFAETTVLRSTFLRCSTTGIVLGNFNALDLFVWYSRFEDCGYGISNNHGGGNFNVYHSVFKSNNKDMIIDQAGAFSCRNNYSIDSNQFFECYTSIPTITFQGNTILDPVAPSDPFPHPIVLQHHGTNFMIDNTIRSLAGVTTQGVVKNGYTQGDMLSVGNIFTSSGYYDDMAARSHSIGDTVVSRASITTAEPTLPSAPTNQSRTIYNVSPGASIQTAITAASADATRSVVHIQVGTHNITSTLTVPANSDIQIIGDGRESKIFWNAGGSGPMIQFASPSRAIVRDLQLMGNDTANGIVVDDCDQSGSRVFMDQPYLENITSNVVVNGLDSTDVRFRSLYHNGDGGAANPSVSIIGGGASGGMTSVHGGASGQSALPYSISGTAHVHLRDIWYETTGSAAWANVSGSGIFTFSGFRIAVLTGTTIAMTAYTGKAALMASRIDGNVVLSGSSSGGQIATIGLISNSDTFYSDTTSPAATAAFINCQSRETPPGGYDSGPLSESGYSSTVVEAVLAETRALSFTAIGSIAAGKTDLRMYRVTVGQCLIGIQLN